MNLNTYRPLPEKGELSKAFQKSVTDYLLVETPIEKADIVLVFGNNGRGSLAKRAAELYVRGYAKKIVVSGGVRGMHTRKEANDIADRLCKMGIPEADILIEDAAMNTGENVTLSKALVAKEIGLENVKSVIAVGSIVAARRFLMTIERHWPGLKMMSAPVNVYNVPRERWYTLKKFRDRVLTEYKKIPTYIERGYIKEVDLKAA